MESEHSNYYDDSGCPTQCPVCNSLELKDRVKERVDYIICEFEIFCAKCGTVIGYWAYGSYDPEFKMYYDAHNEVNHG